MNVSNLTMGGGGKRHSQVLDLLRFPLAIAVVLEHVFNKVSSVFVLGTTYYYDDMPVFSFFMRVVNAFIRDYGVPVFFFISGYLFFLGVDGAFSKSLYLRKLKSRFKTLFIPYILWNVLMLVLYLFYYYPPLSAFFPTLDASDINWSVSAVLNTFWDANNGVLGTRFPAVRIFPQNGPLWFVRDLMFLSILSPLLFFAVKKMKGYFVCFIGCIWFSLMLVDFEYGAMLGGLFFFSFGACFSVNKIDLEQQFNKCSRLSFVLYPLLGTLYVILSYTIIPPIVGSIVKSANIIISVLFAYNLADYLLKKGKVVTNSFLSSSSFFIYVTHLLVLNNFLRLFLALFRPTNGIGFVLAYLFVAVIMVLFILGVYWLMRRFTPRLLGVLVGRRA